MTEPLLSARALTKTYGAIKATDSLSLDVVHGEIHALIGPNGAGKTTAIKQLSGEVAPDQGAIRLDGCDITRRSMHERARLGLARSFQITSVFGGFTAEDNVAMAVQAHDGHSFRFWRPARSDPSLRAPARHALEQVGLDPRGGILARNLAHGEQRQLEIAMALATRPTLLLLDEPMAGMGPDEARRMVELLSELKGHVAMLLVEHDMDAVFTLADRITVLVSGCEVATGSPNAIRANRVVREAYLGEEA